MEIGGRSPVDTTTARRPLPFELRDRLAAARANEPRGDGVKSPERRAAHDATTALMVAAAAAGWDIGAIARAVGMGVAGARIRIRRYDVTAPLPTVPRPPSVAVRKKWLNAIEASTLTGVTRSTLLRWERNGWLPGTRRGDGARTLRYLRSDLEAMIATTGQRRRQAHRP